MIHMKCPHCGQGLTVKPEDAGRNFKCPACGKTACVPEASVEEQTPIGSAAVGHVLNCPHCGGQVTVPASLPSSPPRREPTYSTYRRRYQQKATGINWLVLLIVGGILGLPLLACGGYFLVGTGITNSSRDEFYRELVQLKNDISRGTVDMPTREEFRSKYGTPDSEVGDDRFKQTYTWRFPDGAVEATVGFTGTKRWVYVESVNKY